MEEKEIINICKVNLERKGKKDILEKLSYSSNSLIYTIAEYATSINLNKKSYNLALIETIADIRLLLIQFRLIIADRLNMTYKEVKEKNLDKIEKNGKVIMLNDEEYQKFFEKFIRNFNENPIEYLRLITYIGKFIKTIEVFSNDLIELDKLWTSLAEIENVLFQIKSYLKKYTLNEIDYNEIYQNKIFQLKNEK